MCIRDRDVTGGAVGIYAIERPTFFNYTLLEMCIRDSLVPAHAEIIIEGKVLPHVREEEGPFGEFTDSYVPVMKNHVFEVTGITHREGAFWHDIFAGGREDLNLLGLPIESEIFNHIKKFAKMCIRDRPKVMQAFVHRVPLLDGLARNLNLLERYALGLSALATAANQPMHANHIYFFPFSFSDHNPSSFVFICIPYRE